MSEHNLAATPTIRDLLARAIDDLDAGKEVDLIDLERKCLSAALEAATPPDLTDSVTVHANMLRGTIAKPTVDQIIHLYGREAFQPMIDAAVAKALEDACLAVSEHADWPEDEHGRTEQAGLFARVINAICAIAPAAPHVKETPKSEHDGADVLSAPDLVEAGKVLERVVWVAFDDAPNADGSPLYVAKRDPRPLPDRFVAVPHVPADTIRALIALATAQAAQIAGLTKERDKAALWATEQHASADNYALRLGQEKARAEAAERLAQERLDPIVAAEAEAATLRARLARMEGALVEHNDLLRSALSIAKREGVDGEIASTNWDAYYNRVAVALKRHHQTANEARAAHFNGGAE